MANPHKGEVSFEAAGQQWTLRYSTNAICELEDEFDMAINDLSEVLQTGARLKMLRSVFRAGLTDEHPGITPKEAGEIIDALGYQRVGDVISEAFGRAFPMEEAGERPSKGRKAGTGKGS